MPATLIQIDSRTPFPPSVYIDSNLLIYATDSKSSFKSEAGNIIAELLKQKTKVFLSSLVLDEVWHIFTKSATGSKRGLGLNKVDAIQKVEDYMNLGFEPAEMNSRSVIALATDIFRLPSGFKPRDSFHLACTIFNNLDGFITSDRELAKRHTLLNYPVSIYQYAL